jgi:hypothetical protein
MRPPRNALPHPITTLSVATAVAPEFETWRDIMADKFAIEGNIEGKPLSHDVQQKISDVLKTTLEHELTKTVGAAAVNKPTHGSVTHGSVTKAALAAKE